MFVKTLKIPSTIHEHSRLTAGLQRKGEAIFLTTSCHFHPLYKHLDISRRITVDSPPPDIASNRTETGSLWFPSERKSLTTKATHPKNYSLRT